MAKIISVFNHKGGVGKTTTVFHLAWVLAESGQRVLMVDADSQCNLTGYVLGLDTFEKFYLDYPERNLMSGVRPAFDAMPQRIQAIESVPVNGCENLFLIPGHLNTSLYEVSLGMSHDLSTSIQTLKNLPGAFHEFIQCQIKKDAIDIVIIDMNPSLSAINQNLLCISDAFMVPASPDYFSRMAVNTLSKTLPKWVKWSHSAVDILSDSTYPWPQKTPKFIATIMQNFTKRKGLPVNAFQEIIHAFDHDIESTFLPAIQKMNMAISETEYIRGYIPDFQGLIARMIEGGKPAAPVFYTDTKAVGIVDENYKKNQADYLLAYQAIADGILNRIDLL